MKPGLGGPGATAIVALVDPAMPLVAKPFLTVVPIEPAGDVPSEPKARPKPKQLQLWGRGCLQRTLSPKAEARRRAKAETATPGIRPERPCAEEEGRQLRLKGVFKRGAQKGRARPKGQFDDTPTGLTWSDDDLRRVAMAILEESLAILRNSSSDEGQRWEELYWVCSVSADGMSFDNVCRLLGYDPEEMREVILAELGFGELDKVEAKVAAEHLRFCTEVVRGPRKYSCGDPNDDGRPIEMRWDVLDWFSSRSKKPFDFEDCCDLLDIDAASYRDRIIKQCSFLAP